MSSESRTTNKGLKFHRKYTREDINVFDQFEYDYRSSVIRNPSGEVVFEMNNVEVWIKLREKNPMSSLYCNASNTVKKRFFLADFFWMAWRKNVYR